MKIKSLLAVALAATTLFSCSKEDDHGPGTGFAEGVETFVKVNIHQAANNTKAHYGDLSATAEESVINDVQLFIFDDKGVFEQRVDYTTSAISGVVKTTTGKKTFMAAVNFPAPLPNPTTLADLKAAANEVAIANIAAAATDNNFWMTNVEDLEITLTTAVSEADADAGLNDITINVGRAVAKVGVYFNAPASADGELTNVQYRVRNNPNRMRAFTSYDAAGNRITPYYNTAYNAANYFDNPTWLDTDLDMSNEHAYPSYMTENSNLVPTQQNSTYVEITGQFELAATTLVYDEDGLNPVAPVPGANFWRVYNTTTGAYGSKYYREIPTAAEIAAEGGDVAAEYLTGGTCYYGLWLTDGTQSTTVDQSTIRRNTYWSVEILTVNGPGSHQTVVPGPDPLDEVTHIRANITVIPWEGVEQPGGI